MTNLLLSGSQNQSTTARMKFNQDLYAESLDEAAFLYGQARQLRTSGTRPWTSAEPFEARLEAHLAGLDEPEAFPPLDPLDNLDDPGTLYAVVRALELQGRREDLLWLLGHLPDPLPAQALVDALQEALPDSWMEPVLDELWSKRLEVACRLIGRRRHAPGAIWLLEGPVACPGWAWALGRLVCQESRPALQAALDHEDPEVASQAAIALLRLGDRDLPKRGPGPSWLPLAQGLAGAALTSKAVTTDRLLALGLRGHLDAASELMAALSDPGLSVAAAQGLFTLTGAPLKERVFVPDDLPETPEEHGSEEVPDGRMVTRLSQDPGVWQAWLSEHAPAFLPGSAYCLGKPADAPWLLEVLGAPQVPHWLRGFMVEIIAIRHGILLALEVDMPVQAQRNCLQAAASAPRVSCPPAPFDWKADMMRSAREAAKIPPASPKRSWWT